MTKSIILALTLLSGVSAPAQKKVLFVMSAANELPLQNGKIFKTGIFLSELYPTYIALIQSGFEVDFATPDGRKSTIDQESLKGKYWKKDKQLLSEAQRFVVNNQAFNSPKTLEEALSDSEKYSGMVIPGGQGLMVDLIVDKSVSDLLVRFKAEGKAIGLICHAPALILSIPQDQNPFIGYRVNSVTRLEEIVIENFIMKGKPHNRKIAAQLRKLGLKHRKGMPASNFAIRDRELITSQNPYSNRVFTRCYLEALKEYGEKQQKKEL